MSHRVQRDRSSDAFTLMEIVVGLVLMGTVLASSMIALSRHRKQLVAAENRVAAGMVLDDLLLQLTGQRGGIPLSGQAVVSTNPNWFWRASVVGLAEPMGVPLHVIRVQIFDATDSSGRPLVWVDVVKPSLLDVESGSGETTGAARR